MSHSAFKYFYIDHGQLVIIPLSGVQSFMEVNWACTSGVIYLSAFAWLYHRIA